MPEWTPETAPKQGRKPGAKNKLSVIKRRFMQAIHDAISEQDVFDIVAALKKRALDGDTRAAQLVLEYVCDKPWTHEQVRYLEIDEERREKTKGMTQEEIMVASLSGEL